jgi:hypothetical protein
MPKTMHFLRTLSALLLSAAALSSTAAELYRQSPMDGGTSLDGAYSTTGFFGFQNADAFTLPAASTVTGFRWWGTDAADLSAFVVRLFADLTAEPDTFDALAGTVTQSPTALLDASGAAIFEYELTLTTPQALPAGARYLSVFLDSDTDVWAWLEGAGADGVSDFRGVDGASWDVLPPDLALAVLGDRTTSVPEPTTMLLLGLAGVAAVGTRRRPMYR